MNEQSTIKHTGSWWMYQKIILSMLACFVISSVYAASGNQRLIRCWYDDKGIRECGSVVPPEYARNRIEVINEQGVVVQVIEASRTREEIEREKERQRIRREKEQQIAAAKRRDEILLSTYTNEKELIQARDNNVQGINSTIELFKSSLQHEQQVLDKLTRQAGDIERGGNKPSQSLIDRIEKSKNQIKERTAALEIKQNEKNTMVKRYEDDLKRFRELKRGGIFDN